MCDEIYPYTCLALAHFASMISRKDRQDVKKRWQLGSEMALGITTKVF